MADINQRLAERRITIALDEKAKKWVADKGYDPVFGARPLKRFLQRHLETPARPRHHRRRGRRGLEGQLQGQG
ncbi:MAG: hypothetical protein WDM96_12985 [Lacunisphaera sp.]